MVLWDLGFEGWALWAEMGRVMSLMPGAVDFSELEKCLFTTNK